MKPTFFDIIEETAKLYTFLLNELIKVFIFSDFDIANEEQFFTLDFLENSSIKKYSFIEDQVSKIDGIRIFVFLDKDIVSYKIFLETNMAENYKVSKRCVSLGYKDGFKIFTSKKDVLNECLRFENIFVKSAPEDLIKSKGECSICNIEKILLAWPCHNSHTICEECTGKIVEQNQKCVCPFCRSVLPTTIVLKEDSTQEDEYEDYYIEEDYCIEYCIDEYCRLYEEDFFRKHKSFL